MMYIVVAVLLLVESVVGQAFLYQTPSPGKGLPYLAGLKQGLTTRLGWLNTLTGTFGTLSGICFVLQFDPKPAAWLVFVSLLASPIIAGVCDSFAEGYFKQKGWTLKQLREPATKRRPRRSYSY